MQEETRQSVGLVTLALAHGGAFTVALATASLPLGTEVDLGLRPEHATLVDNGAADAVMSARVRLVERLGNQTLVHLETESGNFTLHGPGDLAAEPGERRSLGFDATRAQVFDPNGKAVRPRQGQTYSFDTAALQPRRPFDHQFGVIVRLR